MSLRRSRGQKKGGSRKEMRDFGVCLHLFGGTAFSPLILFWHFFLFLSFFFQALFSPPLLDGDFRHLKVH